MVRGDLVLWKTAPSANTPGAPSWPNKDLVGRVVSLCEWMNTSDEPTCGDQWVEGDIGKWIQQFFSNT